MAFLPELVLLLGALGLFVTTLGDDGGRAARKVALAVAGAALLAAIAALGQDAVLFDGAYRVDAFSQWLKVVLIAGLGLVLLLGGHLPDIPDLIKPEYQLFLMLSVCGLVLLVSCVEVITLFVALELSAFPLYLAVAMRREREGQRTQMESAIKYIMFGVAANGLMLFGISYLFGLTGTTSLAGMIPRLHDVLGSPAAIAGLTLTFCGLFYKLAIFPFHFWTPDVYQGASNETTGLVASLPKLGAMAVLVRFVSLAAPEDRVLPALFSVLAVASMFYGNLIALAQTDLKRLLGFSGIAHAGYALIGFVALDAAGYAAALYYTVGYLLMVLAAFSVIAWVAHDGDNVLLSDLAGLHRRSPLLAATLGVSVFGLAGIPPFVGFLGKLTLLSAALAKGHLLLVTLAVVNTAIAIYYYLAIVRETFFRDPAPGAAALTLPFSVRALCVALIAAIVLLGVAPGRFLDTVAGSLKWTPAAPTPGLSTAAVALEQKRSAQSP
jgi:NADH-quinone oxidoreductase subunit N